MDAKATHLGYYLLAGTRLVIMSIKRHSLRIRDYGAFCVASTARFRKVLEESMYRSAAFKKIAT